MPRFVLLTHDHPTLHWDFMLESHGALRTWRLDANPLTHALQQLIRATPLADHRIEYLDYEGPVSNNRGTVKRVAAGEYDIVAESTERLDVELRSNQAHGIASIISQPDSSVTFEYTSSENRPTWPSRSA